MSDITPPRAPALVTSENFNYLVNPQVTIVTTMGTAVMELAPEHAPITVANMLAYVNEGFYEDMIFHRVIPNFMAQAGSFGFAPMSTVGPIELESDNGLLNVRGSVAMARTTVPDSATSGFFVNVVDNDFLNHSPTSPGYAVFGHVVSGMELFDAIVAVPVYAPNSGPFGSSDWPVTNIVITSFTQTLAGSSVTNSAVLSVGRLEAGATWEYSLDAGSAWTPGTGTSFSVPVGTYAAGAIRVRQSDLAGNDSDAAAYTSALVVEVTAPTVSAFSPADDGTNVLVTSSITVTFDEAIRRGAGSIVLRNGAGTVIETFNAASSSRLVFSEGTLVVDPTANLDKGTAYTLEIAAGTVKDLAGNSYEGTSSYGFVTQKRTYIGTTGNDTLSGSAAMDILRGGTGDDFYVVGNAGDEAVERAGEGTDMVRSSVSWTLGNNFEGLTLAGSLAIDGTGNTLANELTGNVGANVLAGAAGNDVISGSAGADTLLGGTGSDLLTGGKDSDSFIFDAPNGASNIDTITDFVTGVDKLVLDRSVFAKAGAGPELAPGAFYRGTAAQDAKDRIIYDRTTGALFYDPDGTGSIAQVRFATLGTGATHPALAYTDIQIIA